MPNRLIGFAITVSLLVAAVRCNAGELGAVIKNQHGEAVEDAVVMAMPTDRGKMVGAKPPRDVVDQVDKEFVPFVKPVFVGSLVHFPNKDNIRHHVYSFSAAKKFELPLYAGTSAPPVLFDKPGVVVLGCNIHDWMIGYIYVSETPYFAKSEKDGKASIGDLPAGDYQARIWHPHMEGSEESTVRRITVSEKGQTNIEWQLTLKPEFRVLRASGAKGTGYH